MTYLSPDSIHGSEVQVMDQQPMMLPGKTPPDITCLATETDYIATSQD